MAGEFDAGSILLRLKSELAGFNSGVQEAQKTLDGLGASATKSAAAVNESGKAVTTAFDRLGTTSQRVGQYWGDMANKATKTREAFDKTTQSTDGLEKTVSRSNVTWARAANRILTLQIALLTLSQQSGTFKDFFQGIANGVSAAAAAMQLFRGKVSGLGAGLIGLGVALESFIFRAWEDSIKAQEEGTDQMEKSRKRVDELRFALDDAAASLRVFGGSQADNLIAKLHAQEGAFAANAKRIREIGDELRKLKSDDPGIFGAARTEKVESLETERLNLGKQQTTIIQTGAFNKANAEVAKLLEGTTAVRKSLEDVEDKGKAALDFGIAQPAEVSAANLRATHEVFEKLIQDNFDIAAAAAKYNLTLEQRAAILSKLHPQEELQAAADKVKNSKAFDDAVRATNDLAKSFSSAIGDGLRDAILNAKNPMEALAGIGQHLFENMIDQMVKRLETGLTDAFKAITGAAGEGIGLAITGILGAAGAVLSKLGSSGTDNFASVNSAVTSSQAVRGIVAGPSSVAIATVGDNLARAVAPVVARLDSILGALNKIEGNTRGGGAGRSGSNVAVGTA